MSHGVCRPVGESVIGHRIDGPDDIAAISAAVAYNSMDLLQAPHTLSGVEMALWDLIGRARGEPVWRLLGHARAEPKLPYASLLFGDTPQQTLDQTASFTAYDDPFGDTASGVWADTGYRSKKNEALLKDRMLASHIHRRKPRGRPMPRHIARANRRRSAIRAAK